MVRAVAITDEKVAVGSEGDVGGNKINGLTRVSRVFTWLAMCPQGFARQRRLCDLALIDIAVIENFRAILAAQAKTMRTATKLFAKRAHAAAGGVVHNDGLSAHAGLVHRVR